MLDVPYLSLDAPHMALDGLGLDLVFHGVVSLALLHHLIDLESLFEKIAEYKLKLDLVKCVFRIEPRKFSGSLLTERGMDTNPKRRMSVLSRFAPVGGRGGLPYQECKEPFIRLKEYLASPPALCKSQPSTSFSLYLVVIDQAISSVLVQKQDQFQKLIHIVGRVRQGPEERH